MRPTVRYVALKTPPQLDLQALQRVCERLLSGAPASSTRSRAFLLERGTAIRQGSRVACRAAGRACHDRQADATRGAIIEGLAGDRRRLDECIEA